MSDTTEIQEAAQPPVEGKDIYATNAVVYHVGGDGADHVQIHFSEAQGYAQLWCGDRFHIELSRGSLNDLIAMATGLRDGM
jgi:hypothetical protein